MACILYIQEKYYDIQTINISNINYYDSLRLISWKGVSWKMFDLSELWVTMWPYCVLHSSHTRRSMIPKLTRSGGWLSPTWIYLRWHIIVCCWNIISINNNLRVKFRTIKLFLTAWWLVIAHWYIKLQVWLMIYLDCNWNKLVNEQV